MKKARGSLLVALKLLVSVVGAVVGALVGYFGAAGLYELGTGQFGYEFEGVHLAALAALFGASLGCFAGFRAGTAAVERGSRGLLFLATGLAFLVVGGAGAMAATEAWQRHHMIVKLKQTPYACRHYRPPPKYCRRERPYILRHPSRDIPPWHAAAGGFAGAATGATAVATVGAAIVGNSGWSRRTGPPMDRG